MSILITTVFLVLTVSINAKPGEQNDNQAIDTDPDRCSSQLVSELGNLRRDMALISQKHDDDLASVLADMASMSQSQQTEIEIWLQELHRAEEHISTLEELVQSDNDKQKTSEVYPSPDTSPGNNKMLHRDTSNIKNLINNEANNTLLQAYINQGLSTGVVAFYVRIAGYTGSPSEEPPILYDLVDLNLGGAYDALSGQFTAPVAGIYSFSYEALAGGTPCGNSVCLILFVNSVEVSHSCTDVFASGGATVNVQLVAGDVAWVAIDNLGPCYVLNAGSQYNKFSGHLVYQII